MVVSTVDNQVPLMNGSSKEHMNGSSKEHMNGSCKEHMNGSAEHKNDSAVEHRNGSVAELKSDKTGGSSDIDVEGGEARPQWSSQLDFIFSVVGWAIGLGNVWRFPYLCYKNGGGAFLIPYLIAIITGGVPVFCLEVALGQYMSQGGLNAWNLCPLFQGIGIAGTVILFILNIYYIVVLAWAVNYCAYAFTWDLPWASCNNSWNTERCRVHIGVNKSVNEDSGEFNLTTASALESVTSSVVSNVSFVDPVVEFWERKILQISPGVDEPGGIVPELALSLLFVWVICYFCVWKGIKWTGKVVYFTATFPYIVITILLIRGVTLDGALNGIIFYLKPDFTKLANSQVWIDAGTQIFFSYAIATGVMTSLGSYNRFKNNFYRDCILVSCINSCTSFYAGFAIFSVLGFMAHEQGTHISQVAESGPGLAFIAYPKAVTQMYGAPFWAVLFFFMLLSLGMGSQFVGVESFVTVCADLFPKLRRPWWKESFVAVYCLLSFIIGLSMVTEGGMYVFQLFDYYGASGMCLLWVCFFQSVVIAWVYGVDRFYDNIEQMIGFRINPWLKFCWRFLTPVVTAGIFIFMWVKFEPLTYNRVYHYPVWAQSLGVMLALSSMICVPLFCVYKLYTARGVSLIERWKRLTTPILIPQRIPSHWPDNKELALIGQNHYRGYCS